MPHYISNYDKIFFYLNCKTLLLYSEHSNLHYTLIASVGYHPESYPVRIMLCYENVYVNIFFSKIMTCSQFSRKFTQKNI